MEHKKASSLLEDIQRFNRSQEVFQANMNGKYINSKSHLRAQRKVLGHLLKKHKNANTIDDMMLKENMRAMIKEGNRMITPNRIKRGTKDVLRATGNVLEQVGKWTWNKGKELFGGNYQGKEASQPYVHQSNTRTTGPTTQVQGRQPDNPNQQQPLNWLNVQGLREAAKPVKLDRSLAQHVSRTQVPPSPKQGLNIY